MVNLILVCPYALAMTRGALDKRATMLPAYPAPKSLLTGRIYLWMLWPYLWRHQLNAVHEIVNTLSSVRPLAGACHPLPAADK